MSSVLSPTSALASTSVANMLFSDNSWFQLEVSDGRVRIWQGSGERYTDACMVERNHWGGPRAMVWGRISYQQRTPLVIFDVRPGRRNGVTAQRYIENVLHSVVLPFMAAHPGMTVQQDNARPHTARITTQFLQQNNIDLLPWPSMSPDLSICGIRSGRGSTLSLIRRIKSLSYIKSFIRVKCFTTV